MRRSLGRKPKVKRPKPVRIQIIDPIDKDTGHKAEPYAMLEHLVKSFHEHLKPAKIALAWALGWKPDRDAHVKLGQCRKASDLDRSLHDYDFVILLNSKYWHEFDRRQREALLDHELCHAAPVIEDNSQKLDDQGRRVWRTRKHDVEEFTEIIQRRGCWKSDLQAFVKAIEKHHSTPLYDKKPSANGEVNGTAARGRRKAHAEKGGKA